MAESGKMHMEIVRRSSLEPRHFVELIRSRHVALSRLAVEQASHLQRVAEERRRIECAAKRKRHEENSLKRETARVKRRKEQREERRKRRLREINDRLAECNAKREKLTQEDTELELDKEKLAKDKHDLVLQLKKVKTCISLTFR